MARLWKGLTRRGRAVANLLLAVFLLAAPGSGASELARDTAGLGGPLISRGAAGALAALRLAAGLTPAALLALATSQPAAEAATAATPGRGAAIPPASWASGLRTLQRRRRPRWSTSAR